MEKIPKVSIIIPVYNVENYLRECLDSVINQTLKDIEIICVNDGSTDNSLSILKEYDQSDNRLIILDQNNHGLGWTRNFALDMAKGEYAIFMDPDDFYPSENVLETLYQKAKVHKVQICGGSLCQIRDGNIQNNFLGIMKDYTFNEDRLMKYDEYQFDYGFQRFVYNTKFLRERGICFSEYLRYSDPPFFVKAMISAGQFYSLKKITYCYRIGHNKVYWSKEKIINVLQGLIDNLILSDQYSLSKLHYITLSRLGSEHIRNLILNNLNRGDNELGLLLMRAINLINENLLKKYDPDFDKDLFILKTFFTADIAGNIQKKLDSVTQSVSFKAGRFLTWLPRKLYKILNDFKKIHL